MKVLRYPFFGALLSEGGTVLLGEEWPVKDEATENAVLNSICRLFGHEPRDGE